MSPSNAEGSPGANIEDKDVDDGDYHWMWTLEKGFMPSVINEKESYLHDHEQELSRERVTGAIVAKPKVGRKLRTVDVPEDTLKK